MRIINAAPNHGGGVNSLEADFGLCFILMPRPGLMLMRASSCIDSGALPKAHDLRRASRGCILAASSEDSG